MPPVIEICSYNYASDRMYCKLLNMEKLHSVVVCGDGPRLGHRGRGPDFSLYIHFGSLIFILYICAYSGPGNQQVQLQTLGQPQGSRPHPHTVPLASGARLGEWGGGAVGLELSPRLNAATGSWSHRRQRLESPACTRRPALAVAGKQLRVAGQECAPLLSHPPQTFSSCSGSRNLRATNQLGQEGAAEHPCAPHRDRRAESPLLPRERIGAVLAPADPRGSGAPSPPGKGVPALPSGSAPGSDAPPPCRARLLHPSGSKRGSRLGRGRLAGPIFAALRSRRQAPRAGQGTCQDALAPRRRQDAQNSLVSDIHFLKGRENFPFFSCVISVPYSLSKLLILGRVCVCVRARVCS